MSLLKMFIVLFIVFFMTSCEQDKKSYIDVLNEEKITISKFIDERDFKILDEYPKNGIFKDKEYVLLDNGVYLHVIDSGNGNRPVSGTKILSVAKGQILEKDTILHFNGFQSGGDWAKWPLEFEYGSVHITSKDTYFLGEGYINAMKFVGDSSSVSMIVPFTIGSTYQLSVYAPIYYEEVKFSFVK